MTRRAEGSDSLNALDFFSIVDFTLIKFYYDFTYASEGLIKGVDGAKF